jgi:hypothetical protein
METIATTTKSILCDFVFVYPASPGLFTGAGVSAGGFIAASAVWSEGSVVVAADIIESVVDVPGVLPIGKLVVAGGVVDTGVGCCASVTTGVCAAGVTEVVGGTVGVTGVVGVSEVFVVELVLFGSMIIYMFKIIMPVQLLVKLMVRSLLLLEKESS